jgi:putative phosphoesterase
VTGVVRIVTLADTHIHRGSKRRLPLPAYDALDEADAIVHAGDVVSAQLLEELARFAPTYAVLGNNDLDLAGSLPATRVETFGGVRVGIVHDSGPTKGRAARLRRRFPDCGLVVYGHSHIPFDGPGHDGQWLHNPGSPTERRRQPHTTIGVLDLADGRLVGSELRVVGP